MWGISSVSWGLFSPSTCFFGQNLKISSTIALRWQYIDGGCDFPLLKTNLHLKWKLILKVTKFQLPTYNFLASGGSQHGWGQILWILPPSAGLLKLNFVVQSYEGSYEFHFLKTKKLGGGGGGLKLQCELFVLNLARSYLKITVTT